MSKHHRLTFMVLLALAATVSDAAVAQPGLPFGGPPSLPRGGLPNLRQGGPPSLPKDGVRGPEGAAHGPSGNGSSGRFNRSGNINTGANAYFSGDVNVYRGGGRYYAPKSDHGGYDLYKQYRRDRREDQAVYYLDGLATGAASASSGRSSTNNYYYGSNSKCSDSSTECSNEAR